MLVSLPPGISSNILLSIPFVLFVCPRLYPAIGIFTNCKARHWSVHILCIFKAFHFPSCFSLTVLQNISGSTQTT